MTGINMWVDKSISSDFPDPVYCNNNANWDYMYSATWTYDNVKCTKPPLDMVFLKGYGVPGSFGYLVTLAINFPKVSNVIMPIQIVLV